MRPLQASAPASRSSFTAARQRRRCCWRRSRDERASSATSASSTSTSRDRPRIWSRRWRPASAIAPCSSARNARAAVNEGRADYVPIFLSDVPELFASGVLPLDTVLLNLTRPDAHGYCSFGTSVDASIAATRASKTVIAQLNASMPRTLGDSFIHVDEIDLGVEVDQAAIRASFATDRRCRATHRRVRGRARP